MRSEYTVSSFDVFKFGRVQCSRRNKMLGNAFNAPKIDMFETAEKEQRENLLAL